MIELNLEPYPLEEKLNQTIAVPFHPSFHLTYKSLKRWLDRFFLFIDESIIKDRKSTRLNSSHVKRSRMPSSA